MLMRMILSLTGLLALAAFAAEPSEPIPDTHLRLQDVFDLEYASDPQISPDGSRIVYVRNFFDIMTDRKQSNLWIIDFDGTGHRPLTSGNRNDSSPRWSPDGKRIAYTSSEEGSTQLHLRWIESGETARLTNLQKPPLGISWSPDGKHLAFAMFVPSKSEPFVRTPFKPEGAKWAEPPKTITNLSYRTDPQGYLEEGFFHLFVLPAEGGTPRQVTSGPFHHSQGFLGGTQTPRWTPDSKSLIFSANRRKDWEYEPLDSELYTVNITSRELTVLTDRFGPDNSPAVSRDGSKIAYLGFDDKKKGYDLTRLYLLEEGGGPRMLAANLDRDVGSPTWAEDGSGVFFQYDDQGNTKLAFAALDGEVDQVVEGMGGVTLGRPYSSGSFSVAKNGRFAYTWSDPYHPADVAVGERGKGETKRITALNEDLLGHKTLAQIEEIWYESSHDGRKIHGWVVKPPDFDAGKKYPLILEIHGGPYANYGPRFTAEIQLYAANGYVVLYTNPRGSTSYGAEFAKLIDHNYPSEDYDDLIAGVDAVIEWGYVDPQRLFITGGSGGGILSSWTIGKNGPLPRGRRRQASDQLV